MRKALYIFCGLLCWMALGAPRASAQQPTPDQSVQPIPAYHSPLASAAGNGEDVNANPQDLAPDTRPLTGAQDLSLGAPLTQHSYWQPHFDFSTTADSNGLSATNNTGWTTFSSFYGGVDLHRISGNSNLMLSYLGGGVISNSGAAPNGIVQGLNFSDRFAFRHWALTVFDQLSYLPEASFGFWGLGGASLPGTGIGGLGSGFIPGQSILTAVGQSLSNSTVTEVDAYLTPRSSLTFVGGYSLLHYFDNNLLNSGDATFQAGYNRQLTRQDTLGLLYRFSAIRYSNFGQSINDNVVQVSYARRVTGKLAFQIGAGPEVTMFKTPITTNGASTGAPGGGASLGGPTTTVSWSLNASLTYQLNRTGLGLSYSHGVTGGSGVLAGATADTVTGSASRQLSRRVSAYWNLGFARNNGLAFTAVKATSANQTYSYWFTGAGLNRPWGRALNVNLSYHLEYQDSNNSFCIGPTCGTSLVVHMITFGLGWHRQPIPF
jgi:hypothetical protein